MSYHNLHLTQKLSVRQRSGLRTQLKHIFQHHHHKPLDLPPSEPDHTSPPPDHWMGYWTCATCHATAYPEYYPGPHPYGYLRCRNPSCRTVITRDAETSRALCRFELVSPERGIEEVPHLTGAHEEQIPYLTVCPCGLTHRARLYKPSLYEKWKRFPHEQDKGFSMNKLRRFVKHREDPQISHIEFVHIVCNRCYREYVPRGWQHFVILRDSIFHIDGADGHDRWAEVHHEE